MTGVLAQGAKPAAARGTMYDLTIRADEVYTGTIALDVAQGDVTGAMRLTAPTEITGKVAGKAADGVLTLDYPFMLVERNCEGHVKMKITLPAKPGPAKGTMEAVGCGRDEASKLTGTVELTPSKAQATGGAPQD
jgi:hypothetical protein